MINRSLLTAAIFYYCVLFCYSQNKNSVWIFGDSTGIDFTNSSNPISIASANESRGTSASICDSNGQLLFYAYDPNIALWQSGGTSKLGVVKNKLHQVIKNGDSLIGNGWYHEMVILPMPGSDSLYYLFTVGVSVPPDYGLWYSVININSDSVIQKNIQLQSFLMVDCLTAVKHGNGRDWWLVFRRWNPNGLPAIDEFHSYLISPGGITNYSVQHVGTGNTTNGGQITFNSDGGKFIFTNLLDLIEQYDFDRCTGIISNPVTIQPPGTPPPYYQITWSSAFSLNDNVLYVSTSGSDTSYLYQFDLTAANIYASRITLDTFYLPPVSPGALKLAPDGKIYFSCAYDNGFNFNYPYADTMYNYVNMNLSVINYPDSLGTACGYAPFSFYLGGKRTYYGLPNNPDYELPALAGSPCDTLTGLTPGPSPKERGAELFATWVSSWQKLFVNAQNLKGKKVTVEVFDVTGKVISASPPTPLPVERGEAHNGYFTQDIFLPNLSAGVYVVKLQTEKEMLSNKFVVSD